MKRSLAKALGIALISAVSCVALPGVARAEGFVLTGLVLLSDRGDGIAYLLEPSITKNQVVAVRRGGTIGPYRLARILDDRVELEGPGGTVVIPVRGGGTAVAADKAPGAPSRTEARTEPAADGARGTAAATDRSSRTNRTPFAAAMRDRIRALRKNAADHNAAQGSTPDQRASEERDRAAARLAQQAGAQSSGRGAAAATATLIDMLRAQPQSGSSAEQPQTGESLLGPLLGPR